MRTRLWTLYLAQILDSVFSDHSDPLSKPAGRRWADSLDRVSGDQPKVSGLAWDVASALSAAGLAGLLAKKASGVSMIMQPGLMYVLPRLIRPSFEGTAGLPVHQLLRHRGRGAWARAWTKAVGIMSMDVPSFPAGAVAYSTGREALRGDVSRTLQTWIGGAARFIPGAGSLREIAMMDGNLMFHNPAQQLRRTPIILRDAMALIPAPLTASVLVAGAFLRGTDVQQFRASLLGQSQHQQPSRLDGWWGRTASALGLPPADGQRPGRSASRGPGGLARIMRAGAAISRALGPMAKPRRR
ncbi:MAG: hypothetical protein IIC81_01000 [Chloroflexi bacterium]|nr:hypothetical protein [Chloroflexota bacterium]